MQNVIQCSENTLNTNGITKRLDLTVTPKTTYKMIKSRISLKFNNMWPAQNFELFWTDRGYRTFSTCDSNESQQCNFNDEIGARRYTREFEWSIVPYNTFLNKIRVTIEDTINNENIQNRKRYTFDTFINMTEHRS